MTSFVNCLQGPNLSQPVYLCIYHYIGSLTEIINTLMFFKDEDPMLTSENATKHQQVPAKPSNIGFNGAKPPLFKP